MAEREAATKYVVDTARPLAASGGGLPAFAVRGAPELMAIQARPGAPIRADALAALAEAEIPGLLVPKAIVRGAFADGRKSLFAVGTAAQGPPLSALLASQPANRPWPEEELLGTVLRPAAAALDRLQVHGLTHRAIRLDNIFREPSSGRAVLGQFWAAPPASLQPALFEPPYMAVCPPAGRGAGSIADDVYSLGVVLLILALGRVPLAELDAEALTSRKIERGSLTALAGEERISPAIADLLRGMLAEDPEHRPSPALLGDPSAARNRRVATRPPRRAQRPLTVDGHEVWDTRVLAHALATDPALDAKLLRGAVIDQWIRRSIGDVALANRIEEAVQIAGDAPPGSRGDAARVTRLIAILDPLAPLCWRGLALWPDALGPVLAGEYQGDPRVEEIVGAEIIGMWAEERPGRGNPVELRIDGRHLALMLRRKGPSGGLARLRYHLNPALACLSPLLEGEAVDRPAELLPALERRAASPPRGDRPIDREVIAFLSVHAETVLDRLSAAIVSGPEADAALALVRILGRLHTRFGADQAFPRLSAWIAPDAERIAAGFRSGTRRTALNDRLGAIVSSGRLDELASLLDDDAALEAEDRALAAAIASMQAIDTELARLASARAEHGSIAARIGAELSGATGALAVAAALVALLIG